MTDNTETEGRFGVAEAVYNYLNERRGLPVTLDELVKHTGYGRSQVTGALSHIRKGWRLTIESPRRAVYVLTGERVQQPERNGKHASVVPFQTKAEVIALIDDDRDRLLISVGGAVYVATLVDLG
jgi:hypothetical protein